MTLAKLQATRLVTTPTGDVQKLDAVSGEVLSTIPSKRVKRLQKATDSANLHERAIRYGTNKHGPGKPSVAQEQQPVCYGFKKNVTTRKRAYGFVKASTYLKRSHKPRINWIDELLVAVLCLTIAAIIVVH